MTRAPRSAAPIPPLLQPEAGRVEDHSRYQRRAPIEPVGNIADAKLDAAILAASCGVLLLAAVLQSPGSTQVVVPVLGIPVPELCYTKRWLGIECPGCGLTRSFIAVMHGDLGRAWRFNPAGPAVFAAVAFQIPYRTWHLWRQRNRGFAPRPAWLNWSWAALAAALVIQWIGRF